MGKNKKDNRVDEVESYSYSSRTSDSSTTRSSNSSDSSDSESSKNSSEKEKKKKQAKKKSSKLKKEKKAKRNTSDGSEGEQADHDEREKKKKAKHAKHKAEADERHTDDHEMKEDEKKHRSGKKHKHHHHKHKHKHRHHRHHHSEERQERRRGASPDRSEIRKGREEEERKYKDRLENEKSDRERRMDRERDTEKKDRREERKQKERFESRQIKSRWDDDDTQIDINKRIKVEPDEDEDTGIEQSSRRPDFDQRLRKIKKEKGKDWQEDDRDFSENGRSGWGVANNDYDMKEDDSKPGEEKHKPNMGLSGKLTEDSNTYNGVVIKYSQPPEARKPKRRWRWYIFKGDEDLPFLPLHRQSAYLIGRDRKVADIPTDHPSCSKQHAVLQYRLVSYNREDGTKGRTVKPYILDLESANGTYINNRRIEPRRFVELLEKDVVKFGYSSREYILLHEGSKGEEEDVPDTGVEQDLSPVSLLRS